MSMVAFSHTIFALPFAIIGFLLAIHFTDAVFSVRLLLLVIAAMVFARNAAMGFNRYIDRHIDARNPRTAIREIPSGMISPGNALLFILINCVLFVLCTWFINPICFYLSPVALTVVLGYSLAKRFTALCHLILGIGLSLAPIGAWLAVTGVFAWLPLYYSFAVICWVSGFDMIYALQDEAFDRENRLNSMPVLLGKKGALRLSEILHLISAFFIWLPAYIHGFGWWYRIGAIIFCSLLVYQHTQVKHNDLSKINRAFFTANGIASLVFSIFVVLEFLLNRG
jgi:4-hydroxybenzoate polyprenyltransferase